MQWHTTTIPPASPEYTTAEGADNFYTLPRTPSSLAGSLECALVYSTLPYPTWLVFSGRLVYIKTKTTPEPFIKQDAAELRGRWAQGGAEE